jgi:hypothetical protein
VHISVINNGETEMFITINGQKVSYLKRVSHGAPMIHFAKNGEYVRPYTERVAKGWLNTLRKFGFSAEIVTE